MIEDNIPTEDTSEHTALVNEIGYLEALKNRDYDLIDYYDEKLKNYAGNRIILKADAEIIMKRWIV